jgi:probable phosphoglycerate mutase
MTGNLFESPAPSAASAADWLTAHCDGGSRGNPGPSGYGAVIEDAQGHIVARLSQFLGHKTNNYAEYSGLLAVLKWANENGVKRLRVVSDSELMVKQMKGLYKVKNPGLLPLWEESKRLAARFDRFEMRHTLRGGNQEADRLANEAMDRGMGKAVSGASVVSGVGGVSASSNQPAPRVPPVSPLGPGKSQPREATRQILEGYVKDSVVHLLEGELPDGIFVKVVRE